MPHEPANPLLLQWIKEWYDKAKEQNSKGVFTYKKAHDSMKACPITFGHPSQAQELQGLGPKLCDRLTEKLQEYCKDNGLPMPEDPRKAKQKRKSDDINAADTLTPSEEVPPKKVRATKTKPYVPALRTGPYAILLALSTLSESSGIGLTKQQLIELAQPNCDSSFTAPSDPSRTYTAWNSMKTLQTKDLVYVSGGARKMYMLTDDGWEVTKKIKKVNGLDNARIVEPNRPEGPQIPANCNSFIDPQASRAPPPSSQPLPGSSVRRPHVARPQATASEFVDLDEVDLGNRDLLGALIPERRDRQSSKSQAQLDASIANTKLIDEARLPRRPTKLSRSWTDTDHFELLSSSPNLLPQKPAGRLPLESAPSHSLTATRANTKNSFSIPPEPLPRPTNHNVKEKPDCSRQTLSTATLPVSKLTIDPISLPTFEPIVIPPGSFTIELLLDSREVRSKTDRDYIQSGLLNHGVRPTTRALPVGDTLWVARLADSTTLPAMGEEGDEIVLDYILERKRLDDLVGSIKDGRFTEQKFRLKKSGIKNVVYLVEDFKLGSDTAQHYHEHMQSAVASTMVVNDFFIKKTHSVDDTIAYLARMTRLLKARYEPHPLKLIPSELLTTTNHRPLLASLQEPHHITYEAFSGLTSKSDGLTLRDVFLKMLMCVRGITGEKALEIQRVWGTPRELVEAMQACGDGEVGRKGRNELVFKHLGSLVGRKKVGKAVSAKVAEVWSGT